MINKQQSQACYHNSNMQTPEVLLRQGNPIFSINEQINDCPQNLNVYLKSNQEYLGIVQGSSINNDHILKDYEAQEVLRGLIKYIHPVTSCQHYRIINKRQFISTPIQPGVVVMAYIKVEAGSLKSIKKKLNPQYHLYLKSSNEHIMSAKNFPLKRQIFKISLASQQQHRKYDQQFYGTIVCNQNISNFWLRCPLPQKIQEYPTPSNQPSQELKVIVKYSMNEQRGKKMKVYTRIHNNWQGLIVNKNLDDIRSDNINVDDFLILEENGKNKDFQDFGIRDFNLIDDEDDDYSYLKFTQVKHDTYEIEVQHPLTIEQSFSIALTRFQACLT